MPLLPHRRHDLRLLVLAALLTTATCSRRADPTPGAPERARRFFTDGMTQLASTLADLDVALATETRPDPAPDAFRAARRAYKHIEALLMYYVPVQASTVNGPRSDEDDDAPNAPPRSTPIGFQVVEAALFDGSIRRDSARLELRRMRSALEALRVVASDNSIDKPALVDAVRLQLGRVTVLGLAGFDADASGQAIVEAAASLDGIRGLLATLADSGSAARLADERLAAAAADLRAHPDFTTYDRLRFIVAYANPIGDHLAALQQRVGPPAPGPRRLWRVTAGTPFAAGALDPAAFAPAHARAPTPNLVAVGARLFFDPRLSGSETRACSACHIPNRMFTDGVARAVPLPGHAARLRNTPTLLNVAFEPSLFAEGRARSLETQVGAVLESRAEMASSVDTVAARLEADPSYRIAFAAAMPDRRGAPITGLEVRQAIAAYLRSLTAIDSRFDRAARGDTSAVTASERRGFTLFMSKGKCGTCHFAPLFNGVVPPDYRNGEAEVIGVPATTGLSRPVLDADRGRATVEDVPNNRFAFRVPGLRNVALTAPYMHNGVFSSLEQVVDFYDRGGGAGIGIDVPNQTLPATRLRLTSDERRDLVAFLGALTDSAVLRRSTAAGASRE